MKIKICKCKGRKKVSGKWHDCAGLFVQPFEKECPGGYAMDQLQKAHRLAWLYIHGYFPEYGIDHKDRVTYHNWIDNLREATQQCNMRNTANSKNNTSGIKGVSFNKKRNKWSAYIMVNYVKKISGYINRLMMQFVPGLPVNRLVIGPIMIAQARRLNMFKKI